MLSWKSIDELLQRLHSFIHSNISILFQQRCTRQNNFRTVYRFIFHITRQHRVETRFPSKVRHFIFLRDTRFVCNLLYGCREFPILRKFIPVPMKIKTTKRKTWTKSRAQSETQSSASLVRSFRRVKE